ncbi:hypothetical protein QBC39DRAFT_430698 [Podospora conica]|nr:hypothetical protein QBC39DRAFT_430698 [Schizothecium conicum]
MRDDGRDGSWSPPSSADSEELRATRPNRWTGKASTWKGLTEADRAVWRAMEGEQKKDLSVHLMAAWGLRGGKRRGRVVTPEDGDDEQGSPRKKRKRAWSPGKAWTAWPVRWDEVPDDDIMSEVSGDEEGGYTVRRATKRGGLTGPNGNLEEAISATVLRIAKERFLAREWKGEGEVGAGVLESIEHGESEDGSEEGVGGEGVTDGEDETGNGEGTDGGWSQVGKKERRRARSPVSFKPVPSADDELSYSLLRPVSRRIIGQLDDTLAFLHHAREAGLGSKSHNVDLETKMRHERASRNRHATKSPGFTDGEQMEIDPPVETTDGEGRDQKRKERGRSRRSPSRSTRSRSRSQAPSLPKRIRKWAVRDWRDVMGVAAMAGFPPKVIARATQRCATLFRQPMVLHQMPDGTAPVQTTTYVPGAPLPPSDDEDADAEAHVQQLRAVSRNSSRRTSASIDTDATAATPRGRRSATPGASGKEFLCPHVTCPRAVEPFNRRANLARHIKVMHGGVEAAAAEEQRSGDEMDGAVHVDGFLKPIRARRGWRGEDIAVRTRQTGLKYNTAAAAPAGPSRPSKRRVRKKSTFDSD